MGMDVGGGKGGVKSDINVTPLVDVMLVLLIIMMLIAPLLQQGVSLRLPVADNTVEKPESQDQTVVSIAADKRLYLNAKYVANGEMATKVKDILENKREKRPRAPESTLSRLSRSIEARARNPVSRAQESARGA